MTKHGVLHTNPNDDTIIHDETTTNEVAKYTWIQSL